MGRLPFFPQIVRSWNDFISLGYLKLYCIFLKSQYNFWLQSSNTIRVAISGEIDGVQKRLEILEKAETI